MKNALQKVFLSHLHLFFCELNVEGLQHLPDSIKVAVDDVTAERVNRSHDKLNEAAHKLLAFITFITGGELFGGRVEIMIAPEFSHETVLVELELRRVPLREGCQGKSPALLA